MYNFKRVKYFWGSLCHSKPVGYSKPVLLSWQKKLLRCYVEEGYYINNIGPHWTAMCELTIPDWIHWEPFLTSDPPESPCIHNHIYQIFI